MKNRIELHVVERRVAEAIARRMVASPPRRSRRSSRATDLLRAIDAAARVRRDLLAVAEHRDLEGECGRAAVDVAIAVGDPDSIRLGVFVTREVDHHAPPGRRLRSEPNDHAWTEVSGHVVDVTATQFGRWPAIYVVPRQSAIQYVEIHRGIAAAEQMRAWDYPEWQRKLRQLRALGDA
jgi:hypothetical protein